jgi:hypothetical protein
MGSVVPERQQRPLGRRLLRLLRENRSGKRQRETGDKKTRVHVRSSP